MDDIVTRLRNEVCECGYSASFNELHKCLWCGAADEIERLRAENETLKRFAFPRQNPEYRYFIHPDAVNDYVKVMRGD